MNIQIGSYSIFSDNFDLKLFNWHKSKSSMHLLLWWELVIGWVHIRKSKNVKEIKESIKLLKKI